MGGGRVSAAHHQLRRQEEAYYRWYPTLVTMGDEPGRVLAVSGDDTSGNDVRQMEMYMETSDRFERVWGPGGVGDTSAEHSFPQIRVAQLFHLTQSTPRLWPGAS